MSTLERAVEIAVEAHAGQLDKAGKEYIGHPFRVMEICNVVMTETGRTADKIIIQSLY